jgi:FdhD protein
MRGANRRPVLKYRPDSPPASVSDVCAGEEPLAIHVGAEPLAVTMRTPGRDLELAAGFLVSEAVVRHKDQIRSMRSCGTDEERGNAVDVELADGVELPAHAHRSTYMSSACGLCGKVSIDGVRLRSPYDLTRDLTTVSPAVLLDLPPALQAAQSLFARTGGVHAAGLFSPSGDVLCVREDVGRHNAVDKVIGWALLADRLPLTSTVLLVSGRASFELAQKAVMAGVPVLAAVSAPSALAVDLANETGLTLVGFLRKGSMNVYSGADRIA